MPLVDKACSVRVDSADVVVHVVVEGVELRGVLL